MPLPHNPLLRVRLAAAIARDDQGENSIMQVISIAVSAILIVAGLVAAPGLINSARDTNAKEDLDNIAYVQEYAHANVGRYIPVAMVNGQPDLTELVASIGGDDPKLKLNLSTTSFAIDGNEKTWAAVVVSSSGTVFVRSSDSARTYRGGQSLISDSDPISGSAVPSGVPSGVLVSGTKLNPVISLNLASFSPSGWTYGAGKWTTFNPPANFRHGPVTTHDTAIMNADTVNQDVGFTISGLITMGSDPITLGGLAVSSPSWQFQIIMDKRNQSSAVHIRRNASTTTNEMIAQGVQFQTDVPYLLTVSIKGSTISVSVVDTIANQELVNVTQPVGIGGFSGITKVGVYGYNDVTIQNFVVR